MARLTLLSSSFIRTMTVGSGIAPDLLTLFLQKKALAGSACTGRPYRRWGVSPRPEDVAQAAQYASASGQYNAVVRWADSRFSHHGSTHD
jgi:hypothetical protein